MTTIFKTKTEYFNFIQAWKNACNASERKSQFIFYKEWNSIERQPGWLHASHYILYNYIRNKNLHNGFSFITNSSKLNNGMIINFGLFTGYAELQRIINIARSLLEDKKISDFYKKRINKFLQPFKGTLTLEHLSNVDLDKISPVCIHFGKGNNLANKISEGKQITWLDIKECY